LGSRRTRTKSTDTLTRGDVLASWTERPLIAVSHEGVVELAIGIADAAIESLF